VVKGPATAKVTCLAAGMVALWSAAALAALPPYWQSAREITAIVGDSRVHDALEYEEPITSVTLVGDALYEVKTERCTVQVTIVTAPQAEPIAGPRQFDIEVGEADCR
jgi:hypothetical protein